MSDETNGNGRLDRIENVLAETVDLQREMQKEQMQGEFRFAEYRKQSEERLARMETLQDKTQAHLDYLTQLAGVFADRTVELEDKAKRVKDVL